MTSGDLKEDGDDDIGDCGHDGHDDLGATVRALPRAGASRGGRTFAIALMTALMPRPMAEKMEPWGHGETRTSRGLGEERVPC